MSQAARVRRVTPLVLKELYQHSWYHNLKIPLFYALLVGLGWLAWTTEHAWLAWVAWACP